MNCSICGNQLPENAKFCNKCGTPVQDFPVTPTFEAPAAAPTEDAFVMPTIEPVVPAEETPAAQPTEDAVFPAMDISFAMPEAEPAAASPAPATAPADGAIPVMPTFDFGPMMEDFSATGAIVPPSTTEKVKKSKSGGGSYGGGGGNGKKIAIIAIAVLLVLAILGAAAIFVLGIEFSSKDDDDRKSSGSKNKGSASIGKLPSIGGNVDKDEYEEDDGPKQESAVEQENAVEQESGLSANNPYHAIDSMYDDYVLPESGTAYYTTAAIGNLSYEELVIAQQEIYARHGQRSSDSLLQAYFDNQDWYEETNAPAALNDYEKVNIYIMSYLLSQNGSVPEPATDNPYLPYLFASDGQILSNSNSTYLGASALAGLTEAELKIAEFEIYARYGIFPSDTQLRSYFSCNPNFTYSGLQANLNEDSLNDYEKNNLKLIRLYLKKAQGVEYTSSNPFKAVDEQYGAYVIPYSSTQRLVYSDYSYMSLPVLCIARNEILARHGYTFTDSELLEYFLAQDWYEPNSLPGDTTKLGLSDIENENIMVIKEYENARKANGETY